MPAAGSELSHSPPPPAHPSSSHERRTTEGTPRPHPPASTHEPVSHRFVWCLSGPAAVGSSHSCPWQLTTCHFKNFLLVLHPSPESSQVLSVLALQAWASISTFSTSPAIRMDHATFLSTSLFKLKSLSCLSLSLEGNCSLLQTTFAFLCFFLACRALICRV